MSAIISSQIHPLGPSLHGIFAQSPQNRNCWCQFDRILCSFINAAARLARHTNCSRSVFHFSCTYWLAVPFSIGTKLDACRVDVFGHLWRGKPVPGTAWVTNVFCSFFGWGRRVLYAFFVQLNSFKAGKSTWIHQSLCCSNKVSKSDTWGICSPKQCFPTQQWSLCA